MLSPLPRGLYAAHILLQAFLLPRDITLRTGALRLHLLQGPQTAEIYHNAPPFSFSGWEDVSDDSAGEPAATEVLLLNSTLLSIATMGFTNH